MMKKIFTLCLAAVMLLSLLAGCGGNNGGKTPDAPDPAVPDASVNPPEPAAPSGDPVYIDANASELTGSVRFYTAFAGENGTDALIQEFNSYYPNVTVEYEVYKNNSDGNVAADTSMMAGNVDVILSYGVKNTANRWSNDLLMDITDRLAADNLDLVKEWGSDAYKYNGRVYAFPSGGLSIYVAVNTEKWNAAGLGEIPTAWTWDEYLDACRKLTERDASGSTVVYGGSDFRSSDRKSGSAGMPRPTTGPMPCARARASTFFTRRTAPPTLTTPCGPPPFSGRWTPPPRASGSPRPTIWPTAPNPAICI